MLCFCGIHLETRTIWETASSPFRPYSASAKPTLSEGPELPRCLCQLFPFRLIEAISFKATTCVCFLYKWHGVTPVALLVRNRVVILSIRRVFCHKLCSLSCMEPLGMFRAFLSSFFLMHSHCMCHRMQAVVFMCYRCRWQLSPRPSQSLSHVLRTSWLAPDE